MTCGVLDWHSPPTCRHLIRCLRGRCLIIIQCRSWPWSNKVPDHSSLINSPGKSHQKWLQVQQGTGLNRTCTQTEGRNLLRGGGELNLIRPKINVCKISMGMVLRSSPKTDQTWAQCLRELDEVCQRICTTRVEHLSIELHRVLHSSN